MKKLLLFISFFTTIIISPAQTVNWIKQMGGAGWAAGGEQIFVDDSGNIYNAGYLVGLVDFDPGPGVHNLSQVGGSANMDIYITKSDSSGNLLWANSFGGVMDDYLYDMTVDSFGNVYMVGNYPHNFYLNNSTTPLLLAAGAGYSEGYILKFTSTGSLAWAGNIGVYGGYDFCSTIAIEPSSGNLWIAGKCGTAADLDPGPGVYNMPGTGGEFLLKLDPSGTFISAVKTFNSYDCVVQEMIFDKHSNWYTIGVLKSDTVDFDPGPGVYLLSASGPSDCFIRKIDSSGNLIYAEKFGGTQNTLPTNIIIDKNGNLYTLGYFEGITDFDPGIGSFPLTAVGSSNDIFLAKVDSLGIFQWAKKIGSTSEDRAYAMTLDTNQNVYFVGNFDATMDFDPNIGIHNVTPVGGKDAFICRFNKNGYFTSVNTFGGTGNDQVMAIYIDSLGRIFSTGQFSSTVDFDPSTGIANYTAIGNYDAFMTTLDQNFCSGLTLNIDTASNISCAGQGFTLATASGGNLPYTYTWNTIPTTIDSALTVPVPGIYQVSISDFLGCTSERSVLIGGLQYPLDFDMNLNMIVTPLRAGRQAHITLDAFNDGCVLTAGQLKLVLDTLVIFDSASVVPDFVSGDTLIWNYNPITYDSLHIIREVVVSVPIWASLGDTVNFTGIINPITGDVDTINNIKQYPPLIVGPYDPNIKSVYPSGYCTPHYIDNGQRLTYTVQFQNTGTASAINVFVLDTLDSDLDLNSVRVIGNSHPLITEVLPGNVLKFRFDNIMLPDSTSDEPGSHGYVIFEVEPLPSLANGTEIKNDVGIYFDFNPPIYTNTVLNTISDGIINANTTLSGTTITSSFVGGTYQWIDCNTGDSLVGETNQTFNITANGSYAVIVFDGCLIDTSACINFNTIGINELNINSNFSIYPNPSQNNIVINTNKSTELTISNLLGEIVLKSNVIDKSVIDISQLNNGVYFIRNSEGNTIKFIKQ